MMAKSDLAHLQTDKELAALEKRIAAEYKRAAEELQDKIDTYFDQFRERDVAERSRLQAGEITQQQYKQWRLAQMGRGWRFEALRDRVAERMTNANEVAAAYINDATPGIYSLNRNCAAYTIEQQVGADVGFDLWDEQTVRRLIVERPDLMPYYPPKRAVNRGIDLAYGKRQITAQITSGILQGESVKQLADRLQTSIPNMNRASAIRAARTAVTGAQNAGRLDSYLRAEEMGISLKKRWVTTLDHRTRHDHAAADGQVVEEDKPFHVGGYELMYPGDPSGPGHEIYNCRCTMIAQVEGVDMGDAERRARDPESGENRGIENMTYAEWAGWKQAKSGTSPAATFSGTAGIDAAFAKGMADTLERSAYDAVKAVYAKYQGEIKCVDSKRKGGAFFKSSDGGIHFNAENDQAGSNFQKPYQVAFHEFGHNIDWLINGQNYIEYASNREYNGSYLLDAIKKDYKAFRKSLGVRNHRDLVEHLKRENIPLSARGNISDILEGVTGISYPLGVGHGARYHKRRGATEREFFAEVLDSAAANQESFDQMKRIFPNAVQMVFDIIGGVLK